jgi:hypothetical protein
VAQTVETQGLDILPNRTPGSSLLSAYLQGNSRTTINADVYAQRIATYYKQTRRYVHPLRDADDRRYDLQNTTVADAPIRWPAGYTAVTLSLLIIEQLANVLAGVGALLMVLRRKASLLTRQIGLAALAATVLLTVIRFSGTLAAAYGQERAQLQALVVLAVVFVNTVYLVGAVLGGATSVNLTNSGPVFEYFYVTAPEIASAHWLGGQFRVGELVYADEYGQVPLAAGTNITEGLMTDLTPRTLASQAWVYASQANVLHDRAFALYNNQLATYKFPAAFLDANYDMVYTNGSSEVFHH